MKPSMASRLGIALTAVSILALSMVRPLWAVNAPTPASPMRYHRGLLVGNLAFVDDPRPTVTAGGLYQLSLLPSEIRQGPECGGLGCVQPPRLYGHLLASGGATFDSYDYAALLQAGLVYRLDSKVLTAAGVVAQGALPKRGLGPALRVEVMHNIGVQVGWLFFNNPNRDNGPFISIDYLYTLFDDLELH
jgi:hypothetical protein